MATKLTGAPVLKWNDRNNPDLLEISGTNIYRSTSPMDINNMPTPHDTLTGIQSYYKDINVSYGNTYYYRIGVFDMFEEKITESEVSFTIGEPLEAPFNLDATFYENDTTTIQKPSNLEKSYNEFLGE